jgi:hypothetical protein
MNCQIVDMSFIAEALRQRRLRFRHVLETGRSGCLAESVAPLSSTGSRTEFRIAIALVQVLSHTGGFMRTTDIVLAISLSSLVAVGCDTSTPSTSDDGGDATTDSPSSAEGGADAPHDSVAEAAVMDGSDASEAATEAGDAATEAGDAGDAQSADADAGDAVSLPDTLDAPSLLDALDAPSLGDSSDSAAAADADAGD